MKTITFTNGQIEVVRFAITKHIQKTDLMINNRRAVDENHPELMVLRDMLDVARQALALVEG